jgi:hypothetical protein
MTLNRMAPTRWPVWVGACLLLAWGMAPTAWGQRPPAARLLPDTTVALVSVPNVPETARRFMTTAMGRMSQDPQMKPLVGRLYGSLVEAVAEVQEHIGLSLPELLALPQGEAALAVIAPEEAPLAFVLLLDVGNQLPNANKVLERLGVELERTGATTSQQTVGGTKLVIYDGVGPARRRLIYFEKDATIVLGSDADVLKQLLVVWGGGKGRTLADNPDFTALLRRCRGANDEAPQVSFYADPIGIMRGIGQESTGVRVAVALLPALGLDGLTAVGGSLILGDAQFDTVVHAHVSLGAPRSGLIKAIALESGDSKPERWVPSDVASYTTFHWNVPQSYKELAAVYDSFNGDGALGQMLQQRFLQPLGIDLEKELLPALEGRVTRLTWIERPVTPQSQASVLALKLKNTAVFDKAVEKLSSRNPASFGRQIWAGKTYYQVQVPLPPDFPPERRPPMPCFGILDDYLLVADRESMYHKVVLTLADASQSLAGDPEFQLIAGKIRRQNGGARAALIRFTRPEETVRWLYELLKSRQAQESVGGPVQRGRLFQTLDGALKQNPLPPFEVLRRYLAPGGAMLVDDATGLHYMSFTLRRESD